MSLPPHLQQGQAAEQRACHYLQQQGLELLQRNFRCRQGEIDLIMADGDCIVFVEVRYRRSARYGSSAESVDQRKQQKLITAAQVYLQQQPQRARQAARFDVLAMQASTRDTDIHWIQNAFQTG